MSCQTVWSETLFNNILYVGYLRGIAVCLEDFTVSEVFTADKGLTLGSISRMVPQEDPLKKDFSDQSSLRILHS